MGKSRERFKEIVKVFAHYGFGYMVENKKKNNQKSPENLRKALEELGSTFIKIGQILSTRTDILPDYYIRELSKLQDSAQRESIENLKQVFEESVNKNMDECFKYLNEEPLACASIAEVHQAVLFNGKKVVIKFQRPDIAEKMQMDISILRRIIKFTRTKINIGIIDPLEVLDEIEKTTVKELDFINEGRNILKFKQKNSEVKSIYVPELITELWTKKILVLEEVEGFKITDLEALKEGGYDVKDVANKLAVSYCKQVFDDGFFHADPHPGNLLIHDSKICFLDFGIMGELDEGLKAWLNSAIIAMATRDKNKLVDCILAIGIKKGRVDKGNLYEDVSYLVDNYLTTSLKNIKMGIMLQEVFVVTKKNNIQLPSELIILIRGLIILEGVLAKIDPEFEIINAVILFAKSKGKFGLLKEFDSEEIAMSMYEFSRDALRLPSKSLEVLSKLANGRGVINFRVQRLDDILDNLNKMVNRIAMGLIIASFVVGSSFIINSKAGPTYNGLSIIGLIGYIVSGIFGLVLMFTMVKKKKNKNKKY